MATTYLSNQGTPAATISVLSVSPTPDGLYDMDNGGFYFYPDTGDAGKTFTFTFEARNATGHPTQTMTVNVAAPPAGGIWMCPETYGKQGETRAVGDKVTWDFNVDVGQMANAVQVGMGTASDGTGFHWESAGHQWPTGVDNNQRYQATFSNFQFTEAGQYNVIYQAKANSGDTWTTKSGNGWGNPTAYPPADFGATYFTVAAIPNPSWTSQTAVEGGIQLNWQKATTLHDSEAKYNVMVVRYSSSATSPAVPENNRSTAYVAGNTIGSAGVNQGTVVYIGGDTSKKDTGASNCNSYKYVLYSENYKYFSSGLTPVTVAARCAPAFGSAGTSTSTTVGSPIAEITVPAASGNPAPSYSISPNDVSGASFNASTRKFNFTPTATGTFTFTVTASNVVGTATYTITVTVNAAVPTVGSPSKASIGVTTATLGGTISANGGATVTESGVQVSTDGGTTWARTIEKDPTATSGAFTVDVTGLTANTHYTYRAYAKNSAGYGYSGTDTFDTDCYGAPTAVTAPAGNVSSTGFRVTWTDADGASAYKVQIATNDQFSTGTPAGWTPVVSASCASGAPSGWTTGGSTTAENSSLRLGAKSNTGSLTSPATTPSGLLGKRVRVVIQAKYYSSDSGTTMRVTVNNGPSWESGGVTWDETLTSSYAYYTNYVTIGESQTTVTITISSIANSKRVVLSSIEFSTEGEPIGGSLVEESGTIASGVQAYNTETTLDPGTTYYFRVQASGGTCSAVWSSAGSVTTSAASAAPGFTVDEVVGTATIGDAELGTYQLTKTPDTGFPRTYTYSVATVSGAGLTVAGSGTYSIDRDTGAFSFTPTAVGTYKFTVTASNTAGDGSYTITVTVSAGTPALTDNGLSGSAGAAGATLTASATANGAATTVSFGYSENSGGPYTEATSAMMSGASLAAGAVNQTVTATLSGLTAGTKYYYQWTAKRNGSAVATTVEDWFETDCFGKPGTPTAPVGYVTSSGFRVTWTDVAGASGYKVQIATNDEFTAGGAGATLLSEEFDSTTTDWTVSGTGWYNTSTYMYTSSGNSLKFDDTDDYAITPTFSAGAATLTFWAYGNGGSGSTFEILANDGALGAWATVDTVEIAQGGDDYEVDLSGHPTATQLKFYFTKVKNCALDHVVVSAAGGGSLVEESGAIASGVQAYDTETTLDPGTTYYFRVQASGGTCTALWSDAGSVTTSAANAAPGFTVDEVAGVATVGDAELGTYTLTKVPDTGFPRTYTYTVATVSGSGLTVAGSGTYSIDRDTGAFSFTPTAGGTYKFTVTAANTYGGSSHTGSYTVTVTVTPRKPTIGALTPGEGTLGGTVSGLGSGATVLLRRYTGADAAAAAAAATADTAGTAVGGTTVVSGALAGGTFSDNNSGSWLTGCAAYAYKIRQTENGQTSDWSDVVSGSPTVGAMGTVAVTNGATSLGFGWEAVAGAAGYKVEACLEGEGEAPTTYTGEGTFTRITSVDDFTQDGFYVLMAGNSGYVMNKTVSSSAFQSTLLAAENISGTLGSGGTVVNPPVDTVWQGTIYVDDTVSFMNVDSTNYVTGIKSNANVSAQDEDHMTYYSYWVLSRETKSGVEYWRIANAKSAEEGTKRGLLPTTGHVWKNYAFSNEGGSDYLYAEIYKLTSGGSSCVSETTTAVYHTLTGLESGETYSWTVTPYGASESCTGDEQTGTASTTGTPVAPVFDPASGETNAVVGTELAVTLPAATGFPKAMTYTLTGPTGVSGWTFTATNRAFAFTPAAVGDYEFTLTAENTTGSGTYAFTVHAGAGVPVIGATSAVPSSASAVLSATGVNMMGAASTSITLEYGLTTSYGSSATNVTPASLEADTVNGTLGATLYGLTTGTTYYYKWTVTSTGGVATATGSFETGCIDAPVVTAWHSGHNLKLSWEAVTGAESYKVEVSTDSSFAGAAGAETEVVSTPDDELDTGWSYVNGGDQAKDYHIMTNSSAGVVSPSFSTEPYSRMKVNYSLATYGGPGKNKLTCYYAISMDSGTTWGDWVEIDWDSSTASDNKTYHSSSMELPSEALGKANVKVKWEASTAASGVGLRFRGLSVTGTASGSTAGTTANPAVVTTNATTGKLEWQWEAEEDGNYYYRVTAYSAGCGEVPGSTGGPVDLSEGAVLSLGEATPVSIPWTLTPQAEWAGWVLVWNDDGDFGTPEDGVAPREAGDSFAGGTILQKGAGGSVDVTGTHTGLQACGRYYYKVFAYASGYVWDTTLHKEMGLTAAPLAPTGVAATGVGQRQFTVVWTPTADDGAVRYELTVAKGSMETNTTTALNSDFSSGVAVGWTNSGHTATYAGGTQLASGSNPGSVTSESLNLAGNDGEAKLTVNAMQYKSTESATLKVEVQAGSGSWMNEGELTLSSSAQNYPVTLTNCNTATKIRLSATGGHRVVLYSVKVTVDASSSDETTVLSAVDVSSGVSAGQGSWLVTGLDEYTEYHFGVRAAGVDCDGDWVTNTVTTLGGPMIGTIPTRLSFGGTTPGVAVTKTLVVTNSGHGDLTVSGATFGGTLLGPDPVIKENDAAVAWSMTLAAGESRTLTVTWTPTTGGTLEGTLTLANDTEGLTSLAVTLTGTCRDPMSEPPRVTGYEVRGPADRENTVWDDHLKKTPAAGHEVTVKAWLYHESGIVAEGGDAPSFKIYDADETTLKASGRFTTLREVHRNKREEMECTATVSGWSGDATPGTYRVLVTAKSVNGKTITDADEAIPEEGYYELDRFDRRDGEGDAGHGWTIKTLSDADEVVAIKDGRLVINGSASGQPGANGRGGVVRDMAGGGYATEWGTDQSELTWAFNFASGRQAAWGKFNGGQYAGAFVLGATGANLFGEGTTSAGYAVVMRDGKVQLARMSAGLSGDSSLTPLGSGYPVADGRQAIGVKVKFVPPSEHEGEGGTTEIVPARLMLYVKEWEGRGAGAIAGDSVTGHGVAYETVDLDGETDAALLAASLRYVGMAWNHASSAGASDTYGAFDDVYVPHEEGNGVPMEFDVADEDIEGPVFSDFNARGAFTYTQIPAGGLSITGRVFDASGVYTGTSNKWTLFSNDTQVATGSFAATPSGNGASNAVALSASIGKGYFTDTGTFTNYVLEVESTDYDTDWEGDALTATKRYHFTVTDQVLTEPTGVTADADGQEMVVVRWSASNHWVAIVAGTNAIPEDWTPPQGTDLETGQELDGPDGAKFRVVYVGNGTWVNMGGEGDDEDYRCSEATELTVAPGSTNYYRVYGTAMRYYGKGIAPANYPVTTKKYEKGEIVESFSYPDKVVPASIEEDQWKWASDFSLDRSATGAGWAGEWWFGDDQAEGLDGHAWKIHDGGLLGGTTEFPAGIANKLFWNDKWADGTVGKLKEDMWMKRKLASPMSGGKVFVAFQMNYQYEGAGKYILVSLTGGENFDQEIVSFGMTGHDYTGNGKRYASLTIPSTVTGGDEWYRSTVGDSDPRFQFFSNEEMGIGQDYVVVGELDLSEKKVRLWAFAKDQPIPQDYEAAIGSKWVELYCAGLAGQTVTGVKIGMGSPAGQWMGQAYLDELRLGKTWDETLLFNKPVVNQYAYGVTNGVDKEGHTLYKISDGQLAGHDPLNMNFSLYHRSGIESADVRVLDPFMSGETTLAGWQALSAGSGLHWTNMWTPSGVNREHVDLASNYTVQVKMTATGGKTNMVSSAVEGGGATATDLFIGEYGEGESYDKYIELYNGLEEDIDLRNYYLARMSPERTQTVAFASMTNYTTQGKFFNCARITVSSDTNVYILPKHSTVVLLNRQSDSNKARMTNVLDNMHCHWIMMTNDVLDAGGDVPILLFKKDVFEGTTGCDGVEGSAQANNPTNKPWLDACGYSQGVKDHYIMSRKVESEVLPRAFPLMIEHDEWDHRRWSLKGESDFPDYNDFKTTAGQYDRNIGLGGNMEFTVYDDDTEPPTIGSGSKVRIGSSELAAQPGTTETVLTGWTFHEDGNSSALTTNAWERSMLTNAAITVGPRYAAWLATQGKGFVRDDGTDVNKDFGGITSMANAGCLVVEPKPGWLTAGTDHTWVRFRFGMVKAEDRMFSFADLARTTNSFSSATLEWSTTGRDADDEWTAIASWNPQEETNTWTLRSFDLSESASGIPADVATLYLRVTLSGFSGQGSQWWMDNVQLTGYPDELRVSDKELHESGFSFDANVYDASGVDRAGMKLTIGQVTNTPASWSTGDGVSTDSLARATFPAVLDKAKVTEWYTDSLSGLLHVGLKAKDLDDDRTVGGANVDQEEAEGHFGILQVYDDDEDKPVVAMTGMRAVGGTNMVQWKFVQEGSLMPTAWDDALTVSRLGAKTDGSSEKNMHWLTATNAPGAPTNNACGVRQSGWQHESKYWYFTVTPSTNTQITSLQMFNHINSKYGPTYFTVTVLQGGGAAFGPTAATYFLGGATNEWEDNLDKLNTWIHKSVSMNWTLEKGKTYEFRIQGYGGDKRHGVGAYWGVYDMQFGGSNNETNGMTFKTDADLRAGGSDWLHGSVYDTYSGLDAAAEKTPKFTLTGPDGNTLAENRPLVFATALEENGQKKSEGEGRFTAVVPGMGYTDRKLGRYGGWVSAWDADDDRTEDSLEARVGLALTVVDNDVKGPSAPASVAVNGVPVPGTAPDRYNVTWTNKPEFLVSFNVATDQAPTAEELASEEWCTAHGVKNTTNQAAVTGIGEYRVALANTAEAISNAPGFSVAATNGALANSGFERLNIETETRYQAWTLADNGGIRSAGDRAFPNSPTVTPVPCEGTNCLFVPNGTVGGTSGGDSIGKPQSQVIVFTNTAHVTPKVGGSFWYYKDKEDSSPRLRISAYSNETMVAADRIAFRVVNPSTSSTSTGTWHKADVEFADIGNTNANCILVELYSGNSHSFFDDVRIGVDVGAGNQPTMLFKPDAAGQGLAVKHLFAVDADNDRPGDRLAGPTAAFYTAYDITPPTAVAFIGHGTGASTLNVDDPTTQFDLQWSTSGVGPDDPGHTNHPTGTGTDLLSPWATYKVYYGVYDPVAAAAYTNASRTNRTGSVAYIEDNFITLGSTNCYTNWPSRKAGDAIEDPAARLAGITNYTGISDVSADRMRLYDLEFDQEYVVVVVGVDKAGNEGPADAASWATNNTIKFSLTRGWHIPKADATNAFGPNIANRLTNAVVSALEWTAAGITTNFGPGRYEGEVTKDYDLLKWDARNFQERPDNPWEKIETVRTNWFVDDGGPTKRGAIRFYRASYKDRWRKAVTVTNNGVVTTNAQTPLVSDEVYAQTAVRLRAGTKIDGKNWNFVALHGVPYTNTFRAVFGGTETFPGRTTNCIGTTIHFYKPATNMLALESYYLNGVNGEWYKTGNTNPVSDVVQTNRNFFTRAFSINLPSNFEDKVEYIVTNGVTNCVTNLNYYVAGVETNWHDKTEELVPYLLWKPIVQVPTNGFSWTIQCGSEDAYMYNIVALRLPVATHPSKMNLTNCGFKAGARWEADEIYTIDTITREPGHSCYCDSDGTWKFVSGGNVPGDYFKPNDVLVIVSKNGGVGNSWPWTYYPKKFYPLPNRHMKAE